MVGNASWLLQTTEETELTMPSDFRWHSFLVSAGYLPDTILSVAIWSYKKFKRFAFISYIADTTLTVLILLGDISNLVSRFIKGTPMYHLNLWNLFFLILSVIFIIISIGSRCKNKKISNIFINITTLVCTFVCVIQINTINV